MPGAADRSFDLRLLHLRQLDDRNAQGYEELADKIDLARLIRGKVYPLVELSEAIFPPNPVSGGGRRSASATGSCSVRPCKCHAKQIEHTPATVPELQSVPEPTVAEVMQDAIPDFNDPVDNI